MRALARAASQRWALRHLLMKDTRLTADDVHELGSLSDVTLTLAKECEQDDLDRLARQGAFYLTLVVLPLGPVSALTTFLGGSLHVLTFGALGLAYRIIYTLLFQIVLRLSVVWYTDRWARPMLLLPGWIAVIAAYAFLTLIPIPAVYPHLAPWGYRANVIAKRWQGTLIEQWPLTAYLELYLDLGLLTIVGDGGDPRTAASVLQPRGTTGISRKASVILTERMSR